MAEGELSFVAKLRDEASRAARTLRRNMTAAGGKIPAVEQTVRVKDEASRSLGLIGRGAKALGPLALGAGAAIGAAGIAAGAMGLKTAASMESAEIAFTTMLGSASKAQTFLGELSAFAAKTPFEFPELQTAASSLISAGIEASKVVPIMTTLGNVTSGMGTGSEGVQRATVALQQMSAAGRITGEDLNQLRDAGIPVYDLLASATGKSKAEVVKLAQAGKLGEKELGAMMGALESGKGLERFQGLMEKQSQSLSGQWSTLKDSANLALAGMVQPAIPAIKAGMATVSTAIAGAGPRVKATLSAIGAAAGPALGAIGGFVRSTVLPALASFGGFVRANVLPVVAQIGGAFRTLLPVIGGFVASLMPTITALGAKFAPVLKQAGDVISTQLVPAIRAILPVIAPVARALLNMVGSAVIGAIKGAVQVVSGVLSVLSGVVRTFTALLRGDWAGAWNGVKQIVRGAATAVIGVVRVLLNVGILGAFRKGFGALKAVVTGGWTAIRAFFASGFGGLRSLASGGWSAIRGLFSAGVSAVRGLASAGMRAVVGVFRGAFGGIRSAVSSGLSTVLGLFRGLAGRAVGALQGLGGALGGIGRNMVSGLVQGIRGMAGSVVSALLDLIPGPLRKFAGALGIASPSKVFAGFGKNIVDGLVLGVSRGRKKVDRVIASLAVRIRRGFARKETSRAGRDRALAILSANTRKLRALADQRAAVGQRLAAAESRLVEIRKARAELVANVRDGARAFADATRVEAPNGAPTTAGFIVAGLRERLAAIRNYHANIRRLRRRGLNGSTLRQIIDAGVEGGGATAATLASSSADAIGQVNRTTAAINAESARLGVSAGSAMYATGQAAAAGLVRGLASRARALDAAARTLATRLAVAIKRALGIRSPSRVLDVEVGQQAAAGVAAGLIRNAGAAETAARELAARVTTAARPDIAGLSAVANGRARRDLVTVSRSTGTTVTIRHDVRFVGNAPAGILASDVADVIARDPRSARRLEGALAPVRAQVRAGAITSSR